ncbi:MAG: hypothetical protein RLZZ174_1077, partial [Pseudomonadota bacterium]
GDVQDVIAAAEALGFERFGLIGHSMGGAVTSETAGMFPERVTQATDQSLAAASELVARGHHAVEGGVTWRTDPRIRFATPLRITERQLDELMAQSTAPALLLAATQGDRWYRGGLERRQEHHPNLEVLEMPGPHHLHLEPEHVDRVAAAIREFLGRHGVLTP